MKIVKRTTPWFGIYDYCARIYLSEAFMLRNLDHDYINRIAGYQDYNRLQRAVDPVVNVHRHELHAMCDFLLQDQRPRKIVVTHDWLYLYFNDPTLAKDLKSLDFIDVEKIEISQYQQFGQANAINLHDPKYAYRTYFRNINPSDEEYLRLRDYLLAQEDISLSPGLRMFFEYHDRYLENTQNNVQNNWTQNWRSHRIQEYHFIDHDSPSLVSMLRLLYPRLIRKTLPITAYK